MTQRSPSDLKAENDALRQLLADSNAACPYCGLAATELTKCSRGFPGCARLDDALNGPYPIPGEVDEVMLPSVGLLDDIIVTSATPPIAARQIRRLLETLLLLEASEDTPT